MESSNKPFSFLRSLFWPIYAHELPKFLPLLGIAFFIGFNYNILRTMKEALLLTASSSGAEVLPFIKVWGVIPGAFLMTMLFNRLNNKVKREKVFYAMVGIFLAFFAAFTFILYPVSNALHLDSLADYLSNLLPQGLSGLISMIRYWSFSCFYIMSELWSSIVLSLLFWGVANQMTRLNEAKRFYSLIALGLNLSTIIAGQVSAFLCTQENWNYSMILLTSVIIGSGLMIATLYRYLLKKQPITSAEEEISSNDVTVANTKQPKIRLSMRENFAALAKSKYLLFLSLIVLSYNIVINLIEVIWKDQVKQLYPLPGDYNTYMSHITTITGIISFLMALLLSGQMVRKFGWTLTALTTPLLLLVTSIGFFFFFFGHANLVDILAAFGTSPLALVVLFGAIQNCLCRASKFTLFDSTKEMAFIPLDLESKLKGKAVIDGVGSRLGKSGGSLIHQSLLVAFSSISASAHIVAGILFGVIGVWIFAVTKLGKRFQSLTAKEPVPTPTSIQPLEPAPQEEASAEASN